jgi:hypothetical protein
MSNGLYNGMTEAHSGIGLVSPFTKPGIVREGLTTYFDPGNANSYPGTGTTIYNLVNSNARLISGSIISGSYQSDIAGGVMEMSNGNLAQLQITGNTTLWTTAYTWNAWMVYWGPGSSNSTQLQGIFWSEVGTKNVLFGAANTWWELFSTSGVSGSSQIDTTGLYFRYDSGATPYQSNTNGTSYQSGYVASGFFPNGSSPKWVFMTLVRNSGTSIIVYMNGTRRWELTTANQPAYNTTQPLSFGNQGGGGFTSQIRWGQILLYNRALNASQIYQNYFATKDRYENKTSI